MESKKRKKTISFEESIEKLESIVKALEEGNIPLDKLIEFYKDGLMYQKICQSHLDRASLMLETLSEDGSLKPVLSGDKK